MNGHRSSSRVARTGRVRCASSPPGRRASLAARLALLGMATLVLPTRVAVADDEDEVRRWPVDPDARVRIEIVSGDLEVEGWERAEVRLELDDEDAVLDIDARADRFTIRTPRNRRAGETDLKLRVPSGVQLEAKTVNGEIKVSGVDGTLDLDSANDDIEVRGAPREARLETINASIDFEGRDSRVEARTVNGGIELSGVAGELVASTISGSIEAEAGEVERVELKTLSGSIDLAARLSDGARMRIKSFSGEVRLELPSDTSARFEVESFSGGIRNALPTTQSRTRGRDGHRLDFTTADGDARVSIESFSGGVEIRAKD